MLQFVFQFTEQVRQRYTDRIHRLNTSLTYLINGSYTSVEYNPFETKVVRRYYKRARHHAELLKKALEEKFPASDCPCTVSPHCSAPCHPESFQIVFFANYKIL